MTVQLPPLHARQESISKDTHRFKVLACGRRWGKSFLARREALDRVINLGQNVWWVFPSYNNANDHWRQTKRMVDKAPFLVYKNEQQKYLEFNYKGKRGSLSFKSADRPDNLRGSGLNFVVLDEAAFMSYEVWTDVISPMLLDEPGGDAMFISTPKGKANWFYKVFQLGQDINEPDWMSWQIATHTNPHANKQYLDAQKRLMPRHKYRQEILAEFLDASGGAFADVARVMTLDALMRPIDVAGDLVTAEYQMGVDWGRKNDFTVITVFDKNSGDQVYLDQFTDIGYAIQMERVSDQIEVWQPTDAFIEKNNMGGPQSEKLRADLGSVIKPVYMTNPIKIRLVENLAVNIEQERIHLLKEDTLIGQEQAAQFSAFEIYRTAGGTSISYHAPPGIHDDIIIANILANKNIRVKVKAREMLEENNPFY